MRLHTRRAPYSRTILHMKRVLMACVIVAAMAVSASAEDPPQFMKDTYPEQALKAAWEEQKAVYSSDGAIPLKLKQLIALAVHPDSV